MANDFDRWNNIKKATDAADEFWRLYFREGEIWWVRLGKHIGYETDGKSREFTRPVIVVKKYNQYSFLALPLTTVPKPNPYHLPPLAWWTAGRRSQRSRSCAMLTASGSSRKSRTSTLISSLP